MVFPSVYSEMRRPKTARKTASRGYKVQNLRFKKGLLAVALCCCAYAIPVSAQDLSSIDDKSLSLFGRFYSNFNGAQNSYQAPFSGEPGSNVNLGMLFSPAKGLDLRADAWRVELDKPFVTAQAMPDVTLSAQVAGPLFIDDSNLYAGLLEAPSVKSTVSPGELAKGVDLSASYVWESPRFGQFIVSTKATYLYDTAKTNNLLDSSLPPITDNTLSPKGTDLQSSLMLTWQVGQHTASAVTHYFDSFEDIGTLNLEQLNELVGDLTTLDLQYGYNVKAGKQGQAVFSVGVRNLFDARPDVVLPTPSRTVEQQGRVAYGSIKYQF
jgi:hypothetical protein